jgi:hypothetical protein
MQFKLKSQIVMTLITYMQKEAIFLKQVVDLQVNMIPTTQLWKKLSKDLQSITHSKIP